MNNSDSVARIQKSWDVRKGLIEGILERGETLIESFKLAPGLGESLSFEQWQAIVAAELQAAKDLYGNGEPILSDQELVALASIMNPRRGW